MPVISLIQRGMRRKNHIPIYDIHTTENFKKRKEKKRKEKKLFKELYWINQETHHTSTTLGNLYSCMKLQISNLDRILDNL